ncbi:aspartic peptidase domain-containing protein [Pseudoneurospora amorphoporcata]|uniref:Aspartic peptidase domain-containing protein n=1 Tax=Pseudoneurospora amorphoporcata TaxID=241081 RepID=A0AAN6SE15_9PEZI|nr:aspartic peptidase domain-containing protein [Pseudoneurospora amorphoporcata]
MLSHLGSSFAYGLLIFALVIHAATINQLTPTERYLRDSAPELPGIKYFVPKHTNAGSHTRQLAISHNIQSLSGISHSTSSTGSSKQHTITRSGNRRSAVSVLGQHQRRLKQNAIRNTHGSGGDDSSGGDEGSAYGYENVTVTTAFGTQYAVEVHWNSVPLLLLLDTGSSDTWAITHNFSCLDYLGNDVPQETCGFGPAYTLPPPHTPPPIIPGLNNSTNSSSSSSHPSPKPQPPKEEDLWKPYGPTDPQTHMFIQYGDGEIVTGPMGFADISVGNITVKKQQVALAEKTFWFGNNFTSGLMGLAFPSLTNSYLGDMPGGSGGGDESGSGSGSGGGGLGNGQQGHESYNQLYYPPLFTSMVNQGSVPPLFSITIDRNASSGLLAWGGLPPAIKGLEKGKDVELDMIITNLIDVPETAYDYSFYTVIPDGWQFGANTNTRKFPYIVDSGTTLCYLPSAEAQSINLAFNPPAIYLWMYGAYFTSCDAIVPRVGVILGGQTFYMNPVDLINQDMVDPLTGLCMTAIADGGAGPYILGDVFMQNALTVFDVGRGKMRFLGREFY